MRGGGALSDVDIALLGRLMARGGHFWRHTATARHKAGPGGGGFIALKNRFHHLRKVLRFGGVAARLPVSSLAIQQLLTVLVFFCH